MTALLTPPAAKKGTNPLHPDRVLRSALDLAREWTGTVANDPREFDRSMRQLESVVARFRSAFLAQPHMEAEAAVAYHDRAKEELDADFTPLYYRRAVLENVLARYERGATELLRASA